MATKDFEKDISQQTGFYAAVQKKTFTKWVNSHLGKVGLKVNDLYEDFRDGTKLLSLLEVLNDNKKKFKREKGKMKIHHVQNIQRALTFLEKDCKIKLVNIGSGEIEQGDAKLTLGLVWTLILHFQMSAVSSEQGGIKESLLKWVQHVVEGYDEVKVTNFHNSWKDGMAFCAVIDRHRPDLIDYESCDPAHPVDNMNKAFQVAEEKFGIIRLLDPEDVAKAPEEKSIMTYISYLYHQFPVTPPLKRKKGSAVTLADYTAAYTEMKRWLEDKIKQFKERKFPNDAKQVEAMLVQFKKFKNEELVEKIAKKQELADTEKKLLAHKADIPPILTMAGMDKLWSSMEQEMDNFEKAINDEIARLQKLEDIAVKICKDCGELPPRIGALAEHYKKFVTGCEGKEFTVVTSEHQQLHSEVEDINKVIADINNRLKELEEEKYYNIDTVRSRIKATTDQHRMVTDFTGILGRCVVELMWCLRQQDIECSRKYCLPDVTPKSLSDRHQEFKAEKTEHDVPLIVREANQCVAQKYAFADIIEVVGITLDDCWTVTVQCCDALKCHIEDYRCYCEFIDTMKKAEEQLRDVERNIEKNWNSSSLTDADKKDMLEISSDKVDKWMSKMKKLQEDCQKVYPYDLRVGPLPQDKTTVVPLCNCPQLQLEVGKEYKILADIKGKTRWKVATGRTGGHMICCTLLHITPPSQHLITLLNRNSSCCDQLSSMIVVRLEQADQLDHADKIIQSLNELKAWLQPMVTQLNEQAPVAATMEQLQVQCDWLRDCEEKVNRREPEISRVLSVQLKLQSGPRLDEFNQLKREFTIMWDNFNDKRRQWSVTLEAAQRCFQSTAVVETSVRDLELWILRKGKPPKNQRVLQYIQDVKLFIEEDMSKCERAVKQMTDDYSHYSQSQGRDHDELQRRVDVVNDHWKWLKRIVNKYENQHRAIGSQTDKFDDEYQRHLTWSAPMVEYVNELPKLSVELDQLNEHKRELEEKAAEVRDKEDEVDNIQTSSRMFEASLLSVNEEYDDYRKKLANCSSPVVIEDSEIEQVMPSRSHDPSADVQEGSIVDQAVAVKEQWQRIANMLKQRLEDCNNLIKKLNSFEAKYSDNLAFIEAGEKLIADNHHPGEEPPVSQDPSIFAVQLQQCLDFKQKKFNEQQKHSTMLAEGRKINELTYIDVDNDLGEKLSTIIDRWCDLGRAFDQWFEDIKEAQDNFKQWDTQLKDFVEKLVASEESNPLPVMLEPSKLQSQVDKAQDTFLEHVWPLLVELKPTVDNLEANKSNLSDPQQADAAFHKYRELYEIAEKQKLELEQIKLRADGYAEPFESVSKWITETDRVLVKAKPLAALPVLVDEQLATIKSIEEELKEKLALKEKLIEDTQFIAAQKHSVKPDKLKEVKSDFEDTWKAIEDQVAERRQKAGEAGDKLKECCSIMQPLEVWLKAAEEKAKLLSAIAKSRATLEKQSHDLKEFTDEVKDQSTNVKSTEHTKDQFVELAKDYEKTLEEYSMSTVDLEDRFTRMASITYSQNTKRPTSSASELGRNVLAQDVSKLRQRYDKLLATLEKKWAKLQEINNKHLEVLKVGADANGALNSIQHRKDDLVKQTAWSQPAVLQEHMFIAEDLRKECRALEQGDVAMLKRVFLDLEKARQEYTSLSEAAGDEDDAERCKTVVTDRLRSLEESLVTTKNTLDKAHGKLTAMNQALHGFMQWLEDTEHKLRNISPDHVTLQVFEEVAEQCNAITSDVRDHKTQYDDITGLISDYLTEYGSNPDIEDKSDNLTRRWNLLQEDLANKQKAYQQQVEGLKTLEGKMTEYDAWLGQEEVKIVNLSPLAWSLDLLKQQKEEAKALLDEVESKYEEDYENGIHPLATELIAPYKELDCEGINQRISSEASRYEQQVGVLGRRMNDIDTRSEAVAALLGDQQGGMTSLSKIDEQVDGIPVHSLSSSDVNKLLNDLQTLKDQFNDEKEKVEKVVSSCEELTATPAPSQTSLSPYDDTDLQKSPPLVTAIADGSSSVDATPTATTAQQGEGLGELQEAVKSLEEECAKVEEKLRGKGVTLADRRTAVEKFDKDFNKFHKELDYVTEELSKSPPVMSDDDSVKEQIDKTEKLVEEIQEMEPTLQLLCDNASSLLEGTNPDEESTKSFQTSLADEKKRYKDTLDSAMATSNMLKSESGKVQEVYKLLLPLKSWLTKQQDQLDSMRPAAVLSAPLADQITENEQLGKEVKSKEKDIEELNKAMGRLGDSSVDHPIHKTVRDVTDQYQNINDNITSRANMLSQFKPRVSEYEQAMEGFTQWLNDCCKRVDQLPVADMSCDGLQSQLDDVEGLMKEVSSKEPQCGVIRTQCDQLCNDPTDSMGNVVERSVVTVDYHPCADTARGHVSELDQKVEELKKKLRNRENELKVQQERVKKYQDGVNGVSQWLEEKEQQLNDYNLTTAEPMKIQEKMAAVKSIEEEQASRQPSLDNIDSLLTDVVSGSSSDNPIKQQLEEDNDDLRKRWQQLANQVEDKQEALADALRLAEKYRDNKTKVDQWMEDVNAKLDTLGPPPSNPKEAEKALNKIKTMRDEYEDLRPTHTMCCDSANSLADKTTDPSVSEQLHTAVQQLQEEWQKLEDRLTEADNRLGEALGKASDLDRRLDDISNWLSETLDKFNHLEPCAVRVYLINDQISEAKATLEEISSRAEAIQAVQNIGQEVMAKCSPEDKNEIQMKLNQITTNFADVEEMAKLRLEELNKERMKAEDYEKQAADLDNWLKDKEAMVEQWEEFAIDSATLEQQMEKIGLFEDEVNEGYPVVTNLNDSEKTLLAADLETIRQYEKAFPTGLPEASAGAAGKRRDSKELKSKDSGSGSAFKRKSSKRDKDKKLDSSVDKPQLPDFAKRQGAQEAVDEGKNLRKRYEDLKRRTDNRLAEVQDLLRRVQDYETALGSFGDWLREEKGTVNLIESFACTIEGINSELAKIKEANGDFKKKTKDLERLCKTGTALIDGCKVEESRKEAEQKLSETNTRWGDMLKSLDEKQRLLLAKQKEVEHYMNLLNKFSSWMSSVEKKLEEPVDLVGDPHKIADKLDEIKELAQEIANHKPELDTTVHAGKVAEYAGPAEQADAQPNKPQSGYSIAIKRYEDATAACQERIRQLEETLSKISEVKNDIEQLIEVLNECQSKISSSGRFRVKPDDAKTQLTTAQELNEEVKELQPSIEQKEATGQLFAVAPLAAAATVDDESSTPPLHDTSEDGEEATGSKSPTPTPAAEDINHHPTVPTGKSLKELLEQLAQLNSAVKELSSVKLKQLEDRLEKAEIFEQDYHDASEWYRVQQEELSNAGSVRGIPDGIKEQLAVHMEFQQMIEKKKADVVALKKLAEELKQGVPEIDKDYLAEQLADLDNTVAVLVKSCVKHQQELEEGLKRSNHFYDKLEKAIASVNNKKEELAKISQANLDTPAVKSKLDELNAFQISLKGVGSQVSEVMMLGQQLKDSCSDVDDPELDKRLKELSTLWSQLNSDLQQRIQYLQGILLRLGQFHEDLGKFLTWIDEVHSKLQAAPPPGVEVPEVESKITKLEEMKEEVATHHPQLLALFQAADELMREASDPSDTKGDKLRQYKEDTEKRWNGLDEMMKKRREQLDRALAKANEFRVAFQQETLWLNTADDRLSMEWSPHGLSEKCQEEIEQHKTFIVEVQSHNAPINALLPLGEGLKPQGSKAEKKMVDTWLKGLQDGLRELDKAMSMKEGQLETALQEAEHFEGSYQVMVQWVDTTTAAQGEVEPIKSELDAVQHQLETHKATLKKVSAKEKELNAVMTTGQALNSKCVEEDGEVIMKLLEELHAKWDHLNTLLTQRKTQLEEALLTLGQFQQAFDELWAWLNAIHEQLSDPSPISGKVDAVNTLIAKHSAVQKQLGAKQSTHKAVGKAGKQLLSQKTGEDAETLQKKLNDLEHKWSEVCQMSANWQQKLERTREELKQFNVLIVPLQKWLAKVNPRLSSSEPVYGNKDTVERLMESHKQLQRELGAQNKKVEATKISGDTLVNELLDNPEPVKGSLDLMSTRWDDACKASETRQNRLDQALLEAKLFEASYDDALEWVEIRSGHLASQLAPQEDPIALQQQIEEQKEFSAELLAKQPEIDKVLEKGEQILEEAHPDAVPILQNMIQELQDGWRELKKMASDRSEELATALLELQGVEEMLAQLWEWVEDARKKLATKQAEPVGESLEEVEAQLAEHESFQEDMAAQQPNMEALQKVARRRRGAGGNQDMIRKINDLHKKWQKLWLGATDRHRVLTDARMRLKDIAKARSFNYENWRQRFLEFSSQQKLRLNNLFIKFDANHDRKLNREEFINALKSSGLPMTRIELEKVADVFFPDRRALHLVDVSEIVAKLTQKHDWKKVENESDAVKIEREIQREISKCTCASRFKVEQIGEGKYRFGDSQRPYLVRILRTTVMVRVGGGWITLTEFLQKHDPCRAASRTNLELYKEIRSKKVTPGLDTMEFHSKVESKKKAKNEAIRKAAMEDPEAEVKTRILPSGRKATEISKRSLLEQGETKHVVEGTENDVPSLHAKSKRQLKSSAVDAVPRQKHVLTKKLDREKIMSPPRSIPSATGHLPHSAELYHKGASPSMIPRPGASSRGSPNPPQDKKSKGHSSTDTKH